MLTLTPNQAARQAALRIANGHTRPGDEALALAACGCLHCCARSVAAIN